MLALMMAEILMVEQFSNEGLIFNTMMLSENNQIISDEATIADSINKHFVNIATETGTNELLERYKDHQSMIKILSQMNNEKNLFSFKPFTLEEVLQRIMKLHYPSQNT